MTNEDAIKIILEHKMHWLRLIREHVCEEKEGEETIKAFDKAVSALESNYYEPEVEE